MTDKELIKQEIERRIKEGSSKNDISEGALALNSLLDFIDSLPEEPASEDLEEEISKWRHNHFHGRRDKDASGEYLERKSQLDLARHFAEWQKQQMIKDAVILHDELVMCYNNGNPTELSPYENWYENEENGWIKVDKEHPLPKHEEILGYNKEWREADFNLKGIRIGYLTDEGNFISAKYEPDGEDYISKYEEGDDYQFFQILEDGTKKTWYNNGDDRGDIDGYRPNLPTHYMKISTDGIKQD